MKDFTFFFAVPGRLAGCSWPESRQASEVADFLVHHNVTVLVNLTSTAYCKRLFQKRFDVLHVPTANMTAPMNEQMERIWKAYAALPSGETMSVHCMKGLGRTGTVLACIVGRQYGLDPFDAVARIRQAQPGSIESEEQEQFVREYLRIAREC